MVHKKTIAIIGATGQVGEAIAKRFSATNYRLLLVSNEPERLSLLEAELAQFSTKAEVETLTCEREASWEADIIIVATPTKEGKTIAKKIREVATGKIVVSISQPLNEPGNVASRTSAAEELQELLPYSKIVKTYNTALDRKACNKNCDDTAFLAGNNGVAVDTVAELVKTAGLNPVPVGDLSASRTVENIHSKMTGQPARAKSNWRNWWKGFAFLTAVFADLI